MLCLILHNTILVWIILYFTKSMKLIKYEKSLNLNVVQITVHVESTLLNKV